jgi:hypothetical protein
VSREATLKRTLDGHGNEAPKSPKDHLTLLRNQLPSARRCGRGIPLVRALKYAMICSLNSVRLGFIVLTHALRSL